MVKSSANSGLPSKDTGQDMDRQINGLLQAMYGSIESEPIPERFLDLLEKLDQAERSQSIENPA